MAAASSHLPYRPCAGIMLLNSENRVFVARRMDHQSQYWQMPQGGINDGEDPENAAIRELEEEIDIGPDQIRVLDQIKDWIRYDLPDDLQGKIWNGQYRGQKQKWFCMRFLGEDHMINLDTTHPEFLEWKWVKPDELVRLVIPFKTHVYEMLTARFRHCYEQNNPQQPR